MPSSAFDVESGRFKHKRGGSAFTPPSKYGWSWPKKVFKKKITSYLFGITLLLILYAYLSGTLGTWKRDIGYILRPLWDTPEGGWNYITQYPPPGDLKDAEVRRKWCQLHGWDVRTARDPEPPKLIDAILFSSELDMLEIRMREYEPYVSKFLIVESNMTFSGQPKRTYFLDNRHEFDFIPESKIEYHLITDFEANLPVGSFDNEIKQRTKIGNELRNLANSGEIRKGDMIIQSDVDEIISRQTLQLLRTCSSIPSPLHLNVDNYRYTFQFPLNDGGYYRPKIVRYDTIDSLAYNHGRASNDLLGGSGWHCSFCFATISEIRAKMLGYSHNDRVRHKGLLEPKKLRKTVCEGRDPFDMFPEAFTFKDFIAQSGRPRKADSFNHVPIALKESPDKFRYLLDGGCERPE
ncbi:hypothetical protein I302_107499 [Kwoniella bestiolae CBS 10118]|uniref:Beta-1,4-mannosyl-glycoprotein beta-1,4-N-acetylglucosaminyltransferase n=1 Tax=Kwoniella bestiolae CBS 10118 TaxID=1296100 RepID=A0A1B9FYC6_9TREE|nr:hypothetical protein I302_06760 [Kwoniella bestiolae CBS 10118]OCF23776.1 hypothetical protein I302_06760 [Kwoniella bestiolae CBS 10118]